MKRIWFLGFLITGCIQTDLEDPFDPTLRIDNSVSEIDFRVSGSYPLTAIYTDDTGEPAEASITWNSSNHETLTLNENVAHPHEEGLVLITASFNGLEDTQAIEVLASRETISITGFVSTIQVGNSVLFTANYLDPDGQPSTMDLNWTSSNTSTATVDEKGEVTAVAAGPTDIMVSFGNVSDIVTIEVIDGAVIMDPEIQITRFTSFLDVGEQFLFSASYINENGATDETASIAWASSNTAILSIDESGLATANNEGSATVTASFQRTSATVDVTIETNSVTERTGSLMGTGYDIEGDFLLQRNEEGDVILTITDYQPDGPGPYFYLTNQDSNVANGLNLGEAKTGGDVTINVSEMDASIELTTYNFLMIWCEPFSVRLGVGAFDN